MKSEEEREREDAVGEEKRGTERNIQRNKREVAQADDLCVWRQ